MPEPLLALEGVTLTAGDGRPVFQDLHWQVPRGARYVLQAGQGNGATALLRLCAGLARPQCGRVLLDGAALDVDGLAHPYASSGALGWVPTDGGLAVNLSLLENAALPLRFARGLGRPEAEAEAAAWLERAGLAGAARSRPRIPADRECWLASLARAGAKGSRLWLVDRPVGGLDPAAVRAARSMLEKAAEDPEATLIMVGGAWMAGLGEELRIEDGRVVTGASHEA